MQSTYNKSEAENAGEKFGKFAESAVQEGEEKLKGASHEAQKRLKEGREQVTKIVENFDDQLHENPWPIVAGVAAGALLLGYIMGSRR